MFVNTREFIQKINGTKYRLNTGVRVPENAVNLSYYYSPPLDSAENVIIGDNSEFILENISQPQETLMYADTDNKLKHYNEATKALTNSNMPSELVMITDKFKEDTPLYYCYKLKKLHSDVSDNLEGEYYGEAISLVDAYGNRLPSSYMYKIVLQHYIDPIHTAAEYQVLYNVYVYTSFQIENNFQVDCIYNKAEIGAKGGVIITPSSKESINPHTFFYKGNSIIEAIGTNDKYYMQKSSTEIKSSVIYVGGVLNDIRTPQQVRLEVEVGYNDGYVEKLTLPNPSDDPINVYNKNSALHSELTNFIGNKQKISKPIKELVSYTGSDIISVDVTLSYTDRNIENLSVYVKPDGTGPILINTTIDTGLVTKVPDKHFLTKDNKILTGYSIKYKDRNPIKILSPRKRNVMDSWYVRIQNGRFSKNYDYDANTYHYFLPEYYEEHYDSNGYPYKSIVGEKPAILSANSIKVANYPLYITMDENGIPNNIEVYRIDGYNNKWVINIEKWNDNDGIINLVDNVSENDKLFIDYIFEEQSYNYRGYVKTSTKKTQNFVLLDCNPNKNHMFTNAPDSSDEVLDISSFNLIDKVVYIYMKPAMIESSDGSIVYQNKVLLHTISALPSYRIENEHLILIGVIYVRPNSSFYGLQLTDTRTRGGGLIDKVSEEIRREIEPDSDFYWDIGYWDGEAYPENAVILLRLDRRILTDYGGRFTDDEVQNAVNKHVAFGTLIITEYVETISEFNLQNLNIDISPINRMDYKPYVFIDTEMDIKPDILGVDLIDGMIDPWFDLEVTEDNYKPEMLDIWTDKPEADLISVELDIHKPIAELIIDTISDIQSAANLVLDIFDTDKPDTPWVTGEVYEPVNTLLGYKPDYILTMIDTVTNKGIFKPELFGFELIDTNANKLLGTKPDTIIDIVIE